MAAWTRPVLAPTPVSMRRLALAGVIAATVIISTAAAARLSASRLGCPDWPQCSAADVVASKNAGQTLLNTWIEFGNRLLNFPLVIIAALIFIAAWRFRPDGRRRRDLVWLGAAQPLGVVAQAVIGGIVVLTRLNPAAVSVHSSPGSPQQYLWRPQQTPWHICSLSSQQLPLMSGSQQRPS